MLLRKSFSCQETYPRSAPIWFTESEEASISEILERLSECAPHNYNVTYAFIFICYQTSHGSLLELACKLFLYLDIHDVLEYRVLFMWDMPTTTSRSFRFANKPERWSPIFARNSTLLFLMSYNKLMITSTTR